jgi:DNA-binding transcriptional LysR family regulator
MSGTPPRVSLWAVEVFTATTEEGAITAAARRLGVSAPTVSQQLGALEAALGAELVDRSARPFALTVAGRGFLPHAEAMLDALARGRAGVSLADPAGLTSFRLGMIEDFEAEVTPLLLAGMANDLRQCRFELETGPSHRLLAKLEARGLDVAVAAQPEGAKPEASEVHPLLHEPFISVRPTGGAADLPLIHYSQRTLMGRQIAAHLTREGLGGGHRLELDSYPAILALVAAGQGWTILTPSAVRHAGRSGLSLAPLPGAPLSRLITLTAREGVLGDWPAQVAARLRSLLADRVVAPALREAPWLKDSLRVEPG